jgi:hypothetical protein
MAGGGAAATDGAGEAVAAPDDCLEPILQGETRAGAHTQKNVSGGTVIPLLTHPLNRYEWQRRH